MIKDESLKNLLLIADSLSEEFNFEEAIIYYKKAAALGSAEALCSLGEIYNEGMGVEEDLYIALNYYKEAAEKGDAKAMFNLGEILNQENEKLQNRQEALFWYQKSAEYGYDMAQRRIGEIYVGCNSEEELDKKIIDFYTDVCDIHQTEQIDLNDLQILSLNTISYFLQQAINGDFGAMFFLKNMFLEQMYDEWEKNNKHSF